jgi:hypothetical protein
VFENAGGRQRGGAARVTTESFFTTFTWAIFNEAQRLVF